MWCANLCVAIAGGKVLADPKDPAAFNHLLLYKQKRTFVDFSVLSSGPSEFNLKIKESLLKHRQGYAVVG